MGETECKSKGARIDNRTSMAIGLVIGLVVMVASVVATATMLKSDLAQLKVQMEDLKGQVSSFTTFNTGVQFSINGLENQLQVIDTIGTKPASRNAEALKQLERRVIVLERSIHP